MAFYTVVMELELVVEANSKDEAQQLAGSAGFGLDERHDMDVRKLTTFPPIKESD